MPFVRAWAPRCRRRRAEAAAQADELGCFSLPPPPPGPMRLDCQRGTDRFLTEWTPV
jgi:hypothetical protein